MERCEDAFKNMPKPEPKIKTGTITASDVSKAWEDFDKKIKAALIDMKKESVEPVSIWKDNKDELKKLEKQNEKFLIRTKDGRVIMPIVSNYFTSDNQIDKNIKEATTLTDFINSFEQERLKRLDMEARLRKLEGK